MPGLRGIVRSTVAWVLISAVAAAQQQTEVERYAVVSGHRAATEVGLDVLRDGGNVIDAAIAVSLAIGVAEPCGSGLGGGFVMLYREGATGRVSCLQACPRAPAEFDARRFARLPLNSRRYGWESVAIPALPAGLWAAHEQWGSQPWADLVEPAIRLARDGVEVDDKMRRLFAPDDRRLRTDAEASRFYLFDGHTLPAGSLMKNADLAATLRRLAEGGADGFYRGETAAKIVAAAQAHHSPLTHADLESYEPQFTKPLVATYHGNQIYTSPPPQIGGLTLLMALKALEKQPWDRARPRNAEYVDTISRVLAAVHPRSEDVGADIAGAEAAVRTLMASSSIADVLAQASALTPGAARAVVGSPGQTSDDRADASTTHLVIADRQGNIVSLTQTLSLHYGAGVMAPGTGVLLNNSLSNFSVSLPGAANYAASGKRPRSTVAPIIVTRWNQPRLALGLPGGQRIPTTGVQLLVDMLDFGMSLPEAIAQRRFHLRRPLKSGEPVNVLDVEGLPPPAVRNQLLSAGWRMVVQRPDGHFFGGATAVAYQKNGTLLGVADLRRNNLALGNRAATARGQEFLFDINP